MKAEKTQVEKTVVVKEEVFVLTLTREEADFLARFVGAPGGEEVLQLVRGSIRPLMNGPLTLESVSRMTVGFYRALDGVL